MARYSKSASDDVKRAIERRKAGTLKSGKSGKTVKQEASHRDRALRGPCERQEGSEQEVCMRPSKRSGRPSADDFPLEHQARFSSLTEFDPRRYLKSCSLTAAGALGATAFMTMRPIIREPMTSGVAPGCGQVQFGGSDGRAINLTAGDVAILPAGTGHRRIKASDDFFVGRRVSGLGKYDECKSQKTAKGSPRNWPGRAPPPGPRLRQGRLPYAYLAGAKSPAFRPRMNYAHRERIVSASAVSICSVYRVW